SDGMGIQYVGSSIIELEGVYSASSPSRKRTSRIIVYGKLGTRLERMVILGKATPTKSLGLKPTAFDAEEKIWTKFPPEGSKHTPPHQVLSEKQNRSGEWVVANKITIGALKKTDVCNRKDQVQGKLEFQGLLFADTEDENCGLNLALHHRETKLPNGSSNFLGNRASRKKEEEVYQILNMESNKRGGGRNWAVWTTRIWQNRTVWTAEI
ncbi:membrane occupation and recognition nexus repeat-containing protein, partial [Tanacetum coccineum]